jgi:dipeptidyl aminopeptidase/acylaminoacyl peptidase
MTARVVGGDIVRDISIFVVRGFMNSKRRLSAAVLSIAAGLVLFPALGGAQTKRPMTDKDLFRFVWIGDTQMSPKDGRVVYVQATVTPDRAGYETSLYLLDTSVVGAKPVKLTDSGHDSSPRWSPDGTKIAFVRSAEVAGKPSPAQVYVMPAKVGGTILKVSDLPKGAGTPMWSPDGMVIAVTSSTPQDQATAKLEAAKKARMTGDDAHVSDIKIIDRESYRFNGAGYLDPANVPQVYLVYLPKADGTQAPAWQVTAGRYGVGDVTWSPDSKWIFYTQTRVDEPVYEENPRDTIYGIPVTTAESHPKEMPAVGFTDELTVEGRGLSISPDGSKFAFHASRIPSKPQTHTQGDLWVQGLSWTGGVPKVTGEAADLTGKQSYEMGGGVGGDNTAPRGGGRGELTWTADGKVLDVVGYRGSALLVSVDMASGKVTPLTKEKQAVIGFTASAGAGDVVALISSPIVIGDLFALKPSAPMEQTQLTDVNKDLFAELDVQMPLDLQVKPTVHASDIKGETIDTFVMLPPGVTGKPAKPLPMILNIHGGPHSAYGWVFDQEMLYMAGKGYVVVYPNPRGSTTYGENFANIILNNYPGDDFHDLMDTVDEVVKLGYADKDKLGVTGGSGGGLLTDWVVTQTDRFKAAVAQRDIVDWAGWWYTADAAGFHQSFYPKSPPMDNVELYRAHSPITFVNNIKTPMMFILGDADYRTPPGSGGEQFFRALKYKKIPTVMVRFPRESHELSRSGEPWHRVERLENIVNWFDHFLMGVCEPQYDVAPTCVVK